MGYHFRVSTQLRYQSFDNCLEDEPRVRTQICQSLVYSFLRNNPLQTHQHRLHTQGNGCNCGVEKISIQMGRNSLTRKIFIEQDVVRFDIPKGNRTILHDSFDNILEREAKHNSDYMNPGCCIF